MTEREELAKLIFIIDNADLPDPETEWKLAEGGDDYEPQSGWAYVIADGLIAAGYKREGN